MQDCSFENSEAIGIYIDNDGSHIMVVDTEIAIEDGIGIKLTGDGDGILVKECTITGSSLTDVGIQCESSGSATLEDNTLSGYGVGSKTWEGIRITAGTPTVIENTITSWDNGIYANVGGFTIGHASDNARRNTISGNDVGIYTIGASATPTVRRNDISSNGVGVLARSGAQPDLGISTDSGNNKFLSNSSFCIRNTNAGGSPAVGAYGNYYGSCSGGLPPTCWSSGVVVLGSLCSAPFSAGALVEMVAGPALGMTLRGAYPNPTRGAAAIHFNLDQGGADVSVRIFDVAGRLVRALPARYFGPGEQHLHWDGADDRGQGVSTGMYFARVDADGKFVETAKILVTR